MTKYDNNGGMVDNKLKRQKNKRIATKAIGPFRFDRSIRPYRFISFIRSIWFDKFDGLRDQRERVELLGRKYQPTKPWLSKNYK